MKASARLIVVVGVLGIATVALIWKLASLMIVAPAGQYGPGVALPKVERGPIFDRNGRPLAISTLLSSAHFWKPDMVPGSEAETIGLLSRALGMEEAVLSARLKSSNPYWIKRKLSDTEAEKIRSLKREGKLSGVELVQEYGRNYPEQELACHVLGFVDIDGVGRDGVELSFDDQLAPRTVGRGIDKVYGNQVFLTIDSTAQWICERVARKAAREYRPDSIMILAMDARTAEILAYVSLPDFDPNEVGSYDESARLNRPAKMAYEPGSVFKVVSLASFLERGSLAPTDRFSAPGYYELPNGERIADLAAYGDISVSEVIKFSSNVGAAKASEKIAALPFYESMVAFGFGRRTGVGFTGESAGVLRHPRDWSGRSKATLAIGQELSVTAVQMLSAVTALTNEGIRLKPLVVSKVLAPDGGPVARYGPEAVAGKPVVSARVARMVLDMMETATAEGGTARRAAIEGIRISAKTGTAQVGLRTGGYSEDSFVASFLGVFPTEDPRLVIYVVLENPDADRPYGGILAAPIFKEAAEELIGALGIPRSTDTVYTHPPRVVLESPGQVTLGETMPDLYGLPKRRLTGMLARQDVRLVITGEGYVVRQNPAPGAKIAPGATITVTLE
jgi:cell division protein FtsI (penicillin-binding protein 3)